MISCGFTHINVITGAVTSITFTVLVTCVAELPAASSTS
jgi:hypothetical protein